MNKLVDLKYFGESHIGRRANNEDTYLCRQIKKNTYCFAVADGMGGSNHGEIASKIVVQDLELFLTNIFRDNSESIDLKAVLKECFYFIQNRLVEYIDDNADHSGMGTTLVVLLIHNQNYVCGNIGDSRLYRIMDKEINQLTVDHTFIQQLKEKGTQIDSETNSNFSHLLTKCINGGLETPDIFPIEKEYYTLDKYTGFILCSDGLILNKSEETNDQKIKEIFIKETNLSQLTRKLIEYAYLGGSKDNITTVVVKLGNLEKNKKNRFKLLGCFVILSIIILLISGLYIKSDLIFHKRNFLPQFKPLAQVTINNDIIKNKNNWQPLDTTDIIPKTPTSYIVWAHYPNVIQLKEYNVILLDSTKKNLQKIKVSKKIQVLKMDAFEEIKFPGKFYISMAAVLKDGTLIKGNTISIQTNNSK